MLRSRSGGGQGIEGKTAASGGRSSGRSTLLTTDKDRYLWVVAKRRCLPPETLSTTDETKYKRGYGKLEKRV